MPSNVDWMVNKMVISRDGILEGGCHCGAIRYKVLAAPFATDFCHCRDCQRTTGAPVGAWMDFRVKQVQWLCGVLTEYASSEAIRRGFCATCGATLSYRSIQYPEYLTLAIVSLDNPETVAPTYHIHTVSQLSWLPIQDDHPRYPKGK